MLEVRCGQGQCRQWRSCDLQSSARPSLLRYDFVLGQNSVGGALWPRAVETSEELRPADIYMHTHNSPHTRTHNHTTNQAHMHTHKHRHNHIHTHKHAYTTNLTHAHTDTHRHTDTHNCSSAACQNTIYSNTPHPHTHTPTQAQSLHMFSLVPGGF